MTEQTNTPKLRFPEFKNEWSYDLLGDVVTNKSKKFDPKKEEATKDIELDSIEQNTGRLLDTYISNDFTSQKNKFKKDNVLYSKLRPYLNKYYYATIDGVCSSEIWVLNALNKDVLVNKFLYYFIQTNRFSSVTNKSAGSKMPRADWELVKNIRLYKGSIKEQEKIGYFFSKLDRQIELEEQKLELLEQQKRGYMQQIFSQHFRFKDENENKYEKWRKIKLANILKERKTYLSKSSDVAHATLSTEGIYLKNERYDRDFLVKDKNKKYKVSFKDDICYNPANLKFGVITRNDIGKVIFSTIYITFEVNQNYNPLFIEMMLTRWDFINKVRKFEEGTVYERMAVKPEDFLSYETYIPCLEEQEKIGNFFNDLDKFIEKQSNKIELLKKRKRGFLQKMFV